MPEAKDVKMICEILSREVTQPWTGEADWDNAAKGKPWEAAGGAFDTKTDYQVGRPPGATDSYSIWEVRGPSVAAAAPPRPRP